MRPVEIAPSTLPPDAGAGGFGPRIPELDGGRHWFTTETAKFVCDRARVLRVSVKRTSNSKQRVDLEVSPILSSGWYRQDIDLTMTIEAPDGRVLARRTWDDMTIGNGAGPYAGGSKSPVLKLTLPADRFAELFGGAELPLLRMIVEIQDEAGDEDRD